MQMRKRDACVCFLRTEQVVALRQLLLCRLERHLRLEALRSKGKKRARQRKPERNAKAESMRACACACVCATRLCQQAVNCARVRGARQLPAELLLHEVALREGRRRGGGSSGAHKTRE